MTGLRYAVRSLLRDRGSVALALLALSLGIGATTVIFSVVYSVLVNAFPFRDQSRVVHFYAMAANGQGGGSWWYSAREHLDYKAQNHVFSHFLGGASMEVLYNLGNETYRVRGALIDPQAMPALGVKPALGRGITDADGARGAAPTFMMSDRMWRERFNRDPSVMGMTLKLNGTMRTLIAIAPPRFALHNADVFFPTTITPDLKSDLVGFSAEQPLSVWTYARLKDGVTLEQAADLEVIARNQQRLYPDQYPKGELKVTVVSLADAYTADSIKGMIYILVGAVLMLLLIACSNVANLLLARAMARETELAVRASLGASRGRLMGQLLSESFVLAAASTVIGSLLAYAGLRWVRAAIPVTALPAEFEIAFSTEALLATIGVTVLTTFVCGLVPALRAGRGNLAGRLMATGKGVGQRSAHGKLRTVLVAVQVTLAIVLLIGAGLMMRSLFKLQAIDLGVNTQNVLTGRFAFPVGQPMRPDERNIFVRQVLDKVKVLPGVIAASPAIAVPLQGAGNGQVTVPGSKPQGRVSTAIEFVSDGYFQVVGLSLVRGRLLSNTDVSGARKVAVVNRAFVQTFFDGGDPLGRTLLFGAAPPGAPPDQRPIFDIVGVVGDVRNSGLENAIRPQVYFPYTVPGPSAATILVRTATNPLAMQHSVREQIWAVNSSVALMNVFSMEEIVHRSFMAAPKFGLGLMSTFAAVGLILAAIGVFSVMAYTVSLQTHEIGIRMALGAEPRGVMRMIVLRGLRPIIAGIVLGIGAAYGLTRVMANQIHGIEATDPWTFVGVVAVLAVVALAACVLPARRAMKVDPLVALRVE
jgi:putative ABC transport system permease protein